MSLTFHHAGADHIPRTAAHALLRAPELTMLRRRPGSVQRIAIEAWGDQMHERLTVQGVAHVCKVSEATGRIEQVGVMDPQEVLAPCLIS